MNSVAPLSRARARSPAASDAGSVKAYVAPSDVVVVGDAHELGAQQRPLTQIERPRRRCSDASLRLRQRALRAERAQVDERQLERSRRRDDLHRLTVALGEARAQALVAAHDLA